MTDDKNRDIDDVTGVETTGHEWDGIKELNNPAPRWWLWIFYITIIWSIGYWVVYPAWPTLSGATGGVAEWTQYDKLARDQAEIAAIQSAYAARFADASFDDIMNDAELYEFAVAGGRSAFKDNCATCHGTGGAGSRGYPNLNDDDWLWGGTVKDIYTTILYGIRSAHDMTHVSMMPGFLSDGLLPREDVAKVVDYIYAASKGKAGADHPGHVIFKAQCTSCHGIDGRGMREFGAPNLMDAIWLYGRDRETLFRTVAQGRNGMMPHWQGRLDDNTLRQLAVYVHSLGGGEKEVTQDNDPDTTPDTGNGR